MMNKVCACVRVCHIFYSRNVKRAFNSYGIFFVAVIVVAGADDDDDIVAVLLLSKVTLYAQSNGRNTFFYIAVTLISSSN